MSKEIDAIEKLLEKISDVNYNYKKKIMAEIIYNNRKELGLYTLDDIEIDREKVLAIIDDITLDGGINPEMAERIAKEKPIKVKK